LSYAGGVTKIRTPTVVIWRPDIEALAFQPGGGPASCMVHRRAFRTLLRSDPTPAECEAFFHANRAAFEAAARVKTAGTANASTMNFHLTSRDVARCLGSPRTDGSANI
jgi:hypothetical protein